MGLWLVCPEAEFRTLFLGVVVFCAGADVQDYGHRHAVCIAPAGLLAIAKARRCRAIERVASVVADAWAPRGRKNSSAVARGGRRRFDVPHPSRAMRHGWVHAARLAIKEFYIFLFNIHSLAACTLL